MSDAKSAAAGGAAVAAAPSAAAAAAPPSSAASSSAAASAASSSSASAASSPAAAAANNKAAAASAAVASPPSGPSSLPNNPPGTVQGTVAYAGGRYTGALLNGVPHGYGTLERGMHGDPSASNGLGAQFRGVWEHGHLHVGVRSCARERLHYEGQLSNLERQGMGIEWRVVETPLPPTAAQAAAAAASSAAAAAAAAAPPATRIIGEVHRAGGWSHDERVAECPVPRKFLIEARFIAEADKNSGLELIMPDGTAGHYEGERNERGEPHGRGRVLNARGEAVAGDTWVDGAQEGECFYHQSDGEQYVGGLVRGFKSGHGRHSFPDGEVYEGDWLANLKHGLGCQTWDDGYEFEGEWRNDEQTGFGIEYTRAGKISACGRWLHSEMKEWHAVPRSVLPRGKFLSEKAKQADLLYSDGGYYKGAVNEKSEAHGKGILYTASHQIVQGGRFQHGKLDGEGFTNHPDGGRYAGQHRGGLREGIGKLQLANGDKYSGCFHSNLQHGRGVYTWAKGDVYDGSWCLEYGTSILTRDPSRPTVLVEELKPFDVQRLFLQGQNDASVSLLALDLHVTSHAKFVIRDAEARVHAVSRNHRVPLVWGRDPTYSHHEAGEEADAYPSWTVTAWVKTTDAHHPMLGERVEIRQPYWPEDVQLPQDRVHDDAARPVFRGTQAAARDHVAQLAKQVSLHRGDVIELTAEELWARMETEFRGVEHGCADHVYLAISSVSKEPVPAEPAHAKGIYDSNEPGIRSSKIASVTKHVRGDESDGEEYAPEVEAELPALKHPKFVANAGPLVVEDEELGPFRFVNIAVDGNHRFELANGVVTRNSDVRMHGVGKYSWPDGIVYIGEWVAGVQSGLGFKWSGLGTKAQFGRWLDNKFVQTLYVAPAILAKMPSWTVEEFTHELETRWADYQRPSVPPALGPGATTTTTGATANNAAGGNAAHNNAHGNNGNHASGGASAAHGKGKKGAKENGHAHADSKSGANGAAAAGSPACICTCAYKCQCKCSCPCVGCSASAQADEWAPEVFELIKRMRAAHDIEPHLLMAASSASGHKFREEF